MCSNEGLSACEGMNTNNQYCSSDGVVSTAWTYVEAYDSMPPPMTTMPPPTTTMPPPSGNTTALGDCECMCNDASWIPQTWINKVDCPSGQVCPASEAMCSNEGLSECQAMNTNNQYCSSDGVVSTAWIYVEAYNSSTPGPGGYGDCQCICDGTYAGDIPVTDGQGGKGMAEAQCTSYGAEYCENIFSSACQSSSVTVTVNWAYDSTYDGANMDFSGSGP